MLLAIVARASVQLYVKPKINTVSALSNKKESVDKYAIDVQRAEARALLRRRRF